MGNKKALLVVIILFALFAYTSVPKRSAKASISQITVSPGESIQSAINDAQEGDTIIIQKGIYIEDSYPILVNKTVTLVGESFDTTIIDGWKANTVIFQVQVDGARISDLTMQNTSVGEGRAGVHLFNVRSVEITNCKIRKCSDGIILTNSTSNKITWNRIIDNYARGIHLHENSSFNMFIGNNISANSIGIMIADLTSEGNRIFHNNFIDNTIQRSELGAGGTWDNNYPSGGNYWSDYDDDDQYHGPAQNEIGSDGIGDKSYQSSDEYPLIGMFHSFNTSTGKHVNLVSNSTIEDFEYFESNSTITMHASNRTLSQTFGFCQICIPYALISESYNVTINGAKPFYIDYNIAENGTHRWLYFNYQHSTLKIVIVPEFPGLTFLILGVLLSVFTLKWCLKHSRNLTKN